MEPWIDDPRRESRKSALTATPPGLMSKGGIDPGSSNPGLTAETPPAFGNWELPEARLLTSAATHEGVAADVRRLGARQRVTSIAVRPSRWYEIEIVPRMMPTQAWTTPLMSGFCRRA